MGKKSPVILIHCNDLFLKYTREVLTDFEGAEIIFLDEGTESEIFNTNKVALLITDINSNKSIPTKFVTRYKNSIAVRETIVLYLTNKPIENLTIEQDSNLDFFDVLETPVSKELFLNKIKLLLYLHKLKYSGKQSIHSTSDKNKKEEHIKTKPALQKNVQRIDETSSFLEILIEGIPIPVFIKNDRGEYIKCNKEFEKFTERSKDNIHGKNIFDITSHKIADRINHDDEKILKTGKGNISEETFRRMDGTILNIIIHKNIFYNEQTKSRGIIGTVFDITEIKRTEKLLKIQHTIDYLTSLKMGMASALKNILDQILELEWVDGGGIYLYNKEKEEARLVCSSGLSAQFIKSVGLYKKGSPQLKILFKKKPVYGSYKEIANKNKFNESEESFNLLGIIPLVNPNNNELAGSLNLISRKHDKITKQEKSDLEFIVQSLVSLIIYAQSQEDLKGLNLQLEAKVNQRTKALEDLNSQLSAETEYHKETKEALIYSESIYRSIFENAYDGIVLYDAQTIKLVDFNQKAHQDLGYSKKEFFKLKFEDYIIFDHPKQSQDLFNRIRNNRIVRDEIRLKSKNGDIKHCIFCITTIKINELEFILGIVHDITELVNKENELKTSEKKYRNLQNNIPLGIYSTTLDGKFTYLNAPVIEMFGYSSIEEMMRVPVQDTYYNKARRNELLNILKEKGYLKNLEIELIRKDSSIFWGSISVKTIFDSNGNVIQFDGIIQDIDEKKNIEIEIEKANQKVLNTNKNLQKQIEAALDEQKIRQQYLIQKSKLESLGELAAGIAHEINQPLGVMSLSLENLEIKIESKQATPDYLHNKFISIDENIKRIRMIIDHIRTFSRDQDTMVLEKININKVVRKAMSLIGTQYSNHNVTINLDLKENIGFTVGSNIRVEQMILNLLSNAKYAVDDRAASRNETDYSKEIIIRTDCTDKKVILTIDDNGSGIAEDQISNIFDPFFTTKPEGFGTGLGLSIAYGVIKNMHGDILVDSQINEYTKFEILFPRFPENV